MSPFEIAGLTIFILILFIGIFSTIFGLPGTIIIVTDVIIFSWATGFEKIGFKVIAVLVVISLVAETLDFMFGAYVGVRRFGLSIKGLLAAVIGGIMGGVVLTPFLMGLGTIIGMFCGGFAGTLIVDYIEEKKLKPAYRTGYKNRLMKIAGTVLKGSFAIVMTVAALSTIYS
ncbi:MAG: DUF456 domain-containing protein [Deltaproteobacteria bacterium]|nr:DUF456 domain-containing protein [Deltaproteobacteria bacterium]